jgi:hypothetical protein
LFSSNYLIPEHGVIIIIKSEVCEEALEHIKWIGEGYFGALETVCVVFFPFLGIG